ncbi:MAG TPA: condensation domain-containing protein, partial [Patescibacteria group bacterium]|nr:condensation domain-containing protein [Patescibacteria group bacterium]
MARPGEPLPSPKMLRRFLGQNLPDYMIPAAFVTLAGMPLNANGKLDRKSLPVPLRRAAEAQGYRPPRNSHERRLAEAFAAVLGVARVGVDDNFFALGGHSLLAVRLAARIRSGLGMEMPLRLIFEHPSVAGLAAALGGASVADAAIQPQIRPALLPLSFAQSRLWFLDQLESGGAAYNIPLALRLQGRLDAEALVAALRAVVARHQALRTLFPAQAGEPVQSVRPPEDFTVEQHDLAAALLPEWLAEQAGRRFDLASDLPIRASLLRIDVDDWVLAVVVHHIAADGWSMGLLQSELLALYRGEDLPPLPLQYPDYALWQRAGAAALEARDMPYWRAALEGSPAVLTLPTDRARGMAAAVAATVPLRLGPELHAQLRTLAQRHDATLFMLLAAALATVLGRWSGQNEVVVGTPVAGRSRVEIEGLIGLFVNTVALRIRLDGNPTVQDLLVRAREAALSAFAHQDLPFERIVEAVQPERQMGVNPLFQAMLAVWNGPDSPVELPGVAVEEVSAVNAAAKFDLGLTLRETADGLIGGLDYDAGLFDRATIERLAGHLHMLLSGMVAGPDKPMAMLPLLSEAERRQQVQWNASDGAVPDAVTLVALFEAQAARTPQAEAVNGFDYAGLDRAANQVAHRLLGLGLRREEAVALCVGRGPQLAVGMLGILKAGGVYVPLDPANPDERLAAMLADCAPRLVLTETMLAGRFAAEAHLCLDRDDGWATMPGSA